MIFVKDFNTYFKFLIEISAIQNYIHDNFDSIYNLARINAYYETNLSLNTFPIDNIFNFADLINEDWISNFLNEHPTADWVSKYLTGHILADWR